MKLKMIPEAFFTEMLYRMEEGDTLKCFTSDEGRLCYQASNRYGEVYATYNSDEEVADFPRG